MQQILKLHPLPLSVIALVLLLACNANDDDHSHSDWKVYRGDDGINAYSTLKQINRENAGKLQVAWTYRCGDNTATSSIQCNPIVIDGILYGISPRQKTFALDAKSGKELWKFDPHRGDTMGGGVSRGLAYWENNDQKRIFISASYRLMAIDANTGKQIMSFGDSGYVDLRKGLRNDEDIANYYTENTSPGVVYQNLVIVGARMAEQYDILPGNIRAYDVLTGKLIWTFHTIPEPGEFGHDTWPKEKYKNAGACNAWSGFSIDKKRGIVFAATGAPSFDFHGGDRKGANLFGNSIIALQAGTGKYIWHYQVSHHDLWDYDLPSPPNLITIKRNGRSIDAVAQVTKQGWIFVLDRETGTPLFPVEEKPVPSSEMNDEETSPTQPFPLLPPALARHQFDTNLVTNISKESKEYVMKEVNKYSYGQIYLPQSTRGIIQVPGFRGGAEWSGAAFDRETGIMYVGINDIPNVVQLKEISTNTDDLYDMPVLRAGERVYRDNCAACHGANRKGNGPYPPLLQIENRLKVEQARELIDKGRNKMPSFVGLPAAEKEAVVAYLYNLKKATLTKNDTDKKNDNTSSARRYRITGYNQLKDQFGYPGIKPPWGTLNAVDLNDGKILWTRPLGEYPELTEKGIPETGTQLFGGGVVTAGGVIFIGASKDEKFRVIDKQTGKTIWEYKLPAGGYATPSTYEVDGRQYVVIAAGGGGLQATPSGDQYIAFALPQEN